MKIGILLGYKVRDLSSLLILKKELEKTKGIKASIFGGLSEIQKIYHYLHKDQPDAIIISQIVEKENRALVKYVIDSGALVYVVPAEIAIIKVIEDILVNPEIDYNDYLTKILIPGKRYAKLLNSSDIEPKKIKIVGSPKIDLLVKRNPKDFYSRKKFSRIHGTDNKKKNIFIFTSFVLSKESYLKNDKALNKFIRQMLEHNKCVKLTKNKYIETVKKLIKDFPDYNIILKPHPLENVEQYREIKSDNFRLVEDMTLYNCFNSVDLTIHWSSTVCSESWIMGIKTIQFAPYKKYDKFLSECHPGNPIIRDYKNLKSTINKYMKKDMEPQYKKFQKSYIKNNYYKIDGKSVSRISSIIINDLKTINPRTSYDPKFSILIYLVFFFEKILGYNTAQKIIGLIVKNYDWKRAVENHIYIK